MLNQHEKRSFYEWLSTVKFLNGFASIIAICVNISKSKILGMKNHDCHILMQRLLLVVIGGYLTLDVRQALIELSTFFTELCARALNINVLHRLQIEISIILCKLKIIFAPTLFDIILHLVIQLSKESLPVRLVQYR